MLAKIFLKLKLNINPEVKEIQQIQAEYKESYTVVNNRQALIIVKSKRKKADIKADRFKKIRHVSFKGKQQEIQLTF
jgi:hypothetical protein